MRRDVTQSPSEGTWLNVFLFEVTKDDFINQIVIFFSKNLWIMIIFYNLISLINGRGKLRNRRRYLMSRTERLRAEIG